MIEDERLQQHPLGYYELTNKPTPDELKKYYEDIYFQKEKGNYRSAYTEIELRNLQFQNFLKFKTVNKIRQKDSPGEMLDVGCGEAFSLATYIENDWNV